MNRHLYGPQTGLPLGQLETRCRRYAFSVYGVYHNMMQMTAKIVDDELFLSALFVFRTALRNKGPAECRAFLEKTPIYLCNHWRICSPRGTASNCMAVPELAIDETDPEAPLFSRCHRVLRSCVWCPTDFETTVECLGDESPPGSGWRPGGGAWADQWVITIRSYQQYGSARSPYDWQWQAIASSCIPSRPVRQEMDGFYGSVRDRWWTGSLSIPPRKAPDGKTILQPNNAPM